MAGVLTFTLGLEASNFIRNLGLASGGILTLAGAGKAFSTAMEQVWGAIERGGALNDLANRTSETVGNLYQLQEAFQIVGVSAENVGPMLGRMQKALGGFDENGNRTDKVFTALGLSLEKLKQLNAPQQFEMIGAAMGRLDKNQAMNVSSLIFGREGSGNFIQITRDFESFKQSFKDSADAAAVWQRANVAFDNIGDTLTTVKMKLGGMWAGVAEKSAPAIQHALDFVNAFDFVALGQRFGTFMTAISQAFQEGGLSELIGDAFRLGFDTVVSFAPGVFAKIGFLLVKAFETPMIYLQAGMEYALSNAAHKFANSPLFKAIAATVPGAASILGAIGDTGGANWQDTLKGAKESGIRFNFGSGEFGTDEMNKSADASLGKAREEYKKKWDKFWTHIQEIASRAPAPKRDPKNNPDGADFNIGNLGRGSKPDASMLEKIGFVMGNGRSANNDQRETAQNTRQLIQEVRKLPKALASEMPTGGLVHT